MAAGTGARRGAAMVCRGDGRDDGQAEPAAALVAVARLVEPDQALEDSCAVLGLEAPSVIVHRERPRSVVRAKGDGDARVRMPDRIGDEVVDGTSNRLGIADDRAGPEVFDDGHLASSRALGHRRLANDGVELHGGVERLIVGIGPGQHEEVLHQALESVEFGQGKGR